MALKKTVAGYFKKVPIKVQMDNGDMVDSFQQEWVNQQDIDMHPLEETAIRAHWAIHDQASLIPEKPTKNIEHEWLVDNGADFVKQKRQEWQQVFDAVNPLVEAAQSEAERCHQAWCAHAEDCVAKGLDKDSHDKEKHQVNMFGRDK